MSPELPPPDVVLTGRFEREHEKRYFHLPFTVPPGVRQLHLRCQYSDRIPADPLLAGGNTLDIGLFDERGTQAGSPGFRGWSGSEKLAFTLDREWATPPYLPGPINPGTWHVQLGPYKVGPRGLDYRVEVWFNLGLPAEARTYVRQGPAARPTLPPAAEPGWLRGDLHCHSLYSDGDSWPSELLHAAAEAGLEFLGVTDHNQVAHHGEYLAAPDQGVIVLPGVEVTTYRGHWNAWGVDRWLEFRAPSAAAVAATLRAAAALGALVSVNHPKPFGPAWEYPEVRGYQAIEVWNGPWERLNSLALAFWEAHLDRGERVVALGGSDTHRLRATGERALGEPRLGGPTTWVRPDGPPSAASILAALRAGRSFISAGPTGPQLYLEPEGGQLWVRVVGAPEAALLLIGRPGVRAAAAIAAPDWAERFPLPSGTPYLRAEVVDARGALLALANPVWLDGA